MITMKDDFKEKNILKIVPVVTKIPELVDLSKLGDNYKLGYLERETVGEDYDEIVRNIVIDASEYNWSNDPDWLIQTNGFLDNYFNSFLEVKKSLKDRVEANILYEEDAKREYLNSFNGYLPILALMLCKLDRNKVSVAGFGSLLSWDKNSFPFYFPYKEENGESVINLDEIYEKEEIEEYLDEENEEKSVEESPISYDTNKIKDIFEEILDEKLEILKNDIIKTIKIDKLNELGTLTDELSKIPSKEDALNHVILERDNEIKYLKDELSKKSSDKEIIELRREIRELKEAKTNDLVLADKAIKHKLKNKNKEIDGLTKEISKLKEELKSKDVEYEVKIEKLKIEHEREIKKLTKFNEESTRETNDQNFKLLGELNEWRKKAERYVEELNELKEEMDNKENEENSVYDSKIEELTNQLNESNAINDELRNQIKSMTEDDNTMKRELGESKRKVIELEASVRHLTEDKDNYERRIRELTDKENALKQELNNMKSSINENDNNRLEEIEKENSLLKGSIHTLNNRIEKLQDENNSLRQANDQANKVQNDNFASKVYNGLTERGYNTKQPEQEQGPKTYNIGGKEYTEEELKNTPQYQRLQSLLRPAKK